MMSTLIGHEVIRKRLIERVRMGTLSQTNLFYGTPGIGKRMAACEIAQAIFCEKPEEAPCRVCDACVQMARGTHPDFYQVGIVQAGEEGGTVSDTVRRENIDNMKKGMSRKPMQGNYQVAIIDEAHKLSAAAANTLLKMLEEPREHQIFFLITSRLHHVLMTIRSRAEKIYFTLNEPEKISRIVNAITDSGENHANLETFARAFAGSPGKIAKVMPWDVDWDQYVRDLISGATLTKAVNLAAEIVEKEWDIELFLQMLSQSVFDNYRDGAVSRDAAVSAWERLSEASFRIERRVRKEFVLEKLFMY